MYYCTVYGDLLLPSAEDHTQDVYTLAIQLHATVDTTTLLHLCKKHEVTFHIEPSTRQIIMHDKHAVITRYAIQTATASKPYTEIFDDYERLESPLDATYHYRDLFIINMRESVIREMKHKNKTHAPAHLSITRRIRQQRRRRQT